jgi:predicted nucleic acid-binding protein
MAALKYPYTLYLYDTSVIARRELPAIANMISGTIARGQAAVCPTVVMEVCYSARSSAEFERVRAWLDQMVLLTGDEEALLAAMDAHRLLARRGQHRTPPADLVIAATAATHGAVLMHYDRDYERLAEVLGFRHRWVAPPGSLD